jgi:hypothetical protein
MIVGRRTHVGSTCLTPYKVEEHIKYCHCFADLALSPLVVVIY